ncbi:16S rRNA (guanine(527)-N(7))-methyltransferase RsmG [Solwaraspora sp. WMMD406]|uniref:16S rRNA (guanine(527)-N(7))-methyltransferase RsmG n=1 Tax=Solwaraspora sp. WMMD406 TaxID=3016095 RepID=UPI0024166289|nr:16S rRNA (guanine(527)-N(7))-methyltransferase RsmG [Solwaraspora sp. WMMD406]MDG4763051.1 16S rRNA (guanine(527)-N(7))-methyltransferase RsmG [Solwaraspora sp. WMMD406]
MTDLPVPDDRASTGPDGTPSGPARSVENTSEGLPAVPPAAHEVFGARLETAVRYAEFLAADGVLRGLIGPREVPRLWDRHLLNCAALAELIPVGTTVVDVGSGAGLPGLVLAVARPDLSVVLVEPLARRCAFLTEAVRLLGLAASVEVVRARAEEVARDHPDGMAPIVTARAVAPLDRLVGWCLPLVESDGRLLAMKGSSAATEIAEHRAAVVRAGGSDPALRLCGSRWLDPPTVVVEIGWRDGGRTGGGLVRGKARRSVRGATDRRAGRSRRREP